MAWGGDTGRWHKEMTLEVALEVAMAVTLEVAMEVALQVALEVTLEVAMEVTMVVALEVTLEVASPRVPTCISRCRTGSISPKAPSGRCCPSSHRRDAPGPPAATGR